MFVWAVFGCFIPLITLLFVCLRSPQVPPMLFAQCDSDMRIFEAQFVKMLKARQVAHGWIGAAIGVGVNLIMGMILMWVWAGRVANIATV